MLRKHFDEGFKSIGDFIKAANVKIEYAAPFAIVIPRQRRKYCNGPVRVRPQARHGGSSNE